MTGVWSDVLNLDLLIPSNGQMVAGSGTIYIGGPKLPPEMTLFFRGGIVFYSGANGLAAGVKYLFIAQKDGGDPVDAVVTGYCDLGGTLRFQALSGVGFTLDTGVTGPIAVIQAATTAVKLSTDLVKFDASPSTVSAPFKFLGSQARLFLSGMNSRVPALRGDNGVAATTDLDQWFTSSNVQTIGGVGGFTVKQAWRMTPDYIIDYRVFITGGAAFPASNVASYTLPAAMPTIDSPSITGSVMNPFVPASGEGGLGFYPMSIRPEPTGIANIFLAGNPRNNTALEGGGTLSIVKPT